MMNSNKAILLITAHTQSVREGNVFGFSVHRGGPSNGPRG